MSSYCIQGKLTHDVHFASLYGYSIGVYLLHMLTEYCLFTL